MVVQLQKIHCFVKWFNNRLFYRIFLNTSIKQCMYLKKATLCMVVLDNRGSSMKKFRFNTNYNITQEPQELENTIVPVGSSTSPMG